MDAEDRQEAERKEVNGQNDDLGARHLFALILLAASFAAMPWITRSFGMTAFVATYAVAAILWWTIRSRVVAFRTALAIALLLRLAVAFAPPLLSTDVYRYFWDGTLLSSGVNPYVYAPDDERLAAFQQEWHSKINHPGIRTIYPPHAQLLFAAIHHLAPWRVLLITCDLLTLALLRKRTPYLLAIAAFPPLIVEGVWSAHVDAIAAMFMTRALVGVSGLAAAIAVGLKLIPIAAVPSHLRNGGRRFAVSFALVLLLPCLAFSAFGDVMPGLRDFATRWSFNSPLYSIAVQLVDETTFKALWTWIKDAFGLESIAGVVYARLFPDFIARCFLALVAILGIAIVSRRRDGAVHSVGVLLICSPVIHPWYWLAIVPLAVASRIEPWRSLALFAPLSYLLYDGTAPWLVFVACYALPLIVNAPPRLSAIATSVAEWHRAAIRSRTEPGASRS